MPALILSELWIYPIKSFAGIRVKQAVVKPKGLQYDRRWMLVDENGKFITQRENPHMALFDLAIQNQQIVISARLTGKQLVIPLVAPEIKEVQNVVIWGDEVEAVEPDKNYSQWFTEQLNLKCRLVFFPEANKRDVDPHYASNNEQVGFADGYPILIIGQSSLNDLNSRLDEPIEMRRFRPNFVFTGGQPFEEDNWRNFNIGTNRFKVVKPCARCVLTTINPETGQKGREPLFTLSKYRREGNKLLFGQNVIALNHNNQLREGDEITLE
ncbi:MAG: MOSC domain-containing protein [Bacteroidetes bacterium CHB5]|nr:MOSC domain-containing protein [Bacteroidetes bacterium CHB5]